MDGGQLFDGGQVGRLGLKNCTLDNLVGIVCASPPRYDVRNKLEDKRLFGLKPNLSHKLSAKERSLEEELDRERYLALEWDDIRVEEQEGGLHLGHLED